VVTDGQFRLQPGSKVSTGSPAAASSTAPADDASKGKKHHHQADQ
jgi:hypothetical protein